MGEDVLHLLVYLFISLTCHGFLFLTAGFLLKRSAKKKGWNRRWFILNKKSGKVGNVLFLPIKSIITVCLNTFLK